MPGQSHRSVRDSSQELVNKVMPAHDAAHRMRAIHQALDHAASVGVTSVQDMNPILRRRESLC